ncbi:MAG: hypothetical protein ABR504_00965 [Paracoccaceae bacterium]
MAQTDHACQPRSGIANNLFLLTENWEMAVIEGQTKGTGNDRD